MSMVSPRVMPNNATIATHILRPTMSDMFDTLRELTSPDFGRRDYVDRKRRVNDFAGHLGWRPSDYLEPKYGLSEKSNGHLIVEHGLENAAVITFLRQPTRVCDLLPHETRSLLQVSYNNLVDWHLTVDEDSVSRYFNRAEPLLPEHKPIAASNLEAVSSDHLERAFRKIPRANLPALDTVLVKTIEYWRGFLYTEINCKTKNLALSTLFNAIMFVRAVEDHYAFFKGENGPPILLERWRKGGGKHANLPNIIRSVLGDYSASQGASSLLQLKLLEAFDHVDGQTIENLIADFYKVKDTPYSYNFALMSRHALSRIYEKYVALMRQEESQKTPQRTLFTIDLPESERNKAAGAIYTPQFIPRFFCRFIENQLPAKAFRELSVVDPACGSGIFLRTFLERQAAQGEGGFEEIKRSFERCCGLDVDENACQASRLSLALLHLTLTRGLPAKLNINAEEAIAFYQSKKGLSEAFDAAVGNPPFVRLELQSSAIQERLRAFLADIKGRPDLFLGILRVSMGMVRSGGFLAMVLPHSFLIDKTPTPLREELKEHFWIRCVVDLSAIRVFGDISAYIILLIAQKKEPGIPVSPPACDVVLCRDFVGQALQDCLEGKKQQNPYYSVFEVEQEYFGDTPWVLVGPDYLPIERKLRTMPKLSDFLVIQEGLITGADKVYIRPYEDVPPSERHLYAPFLRDREIQRYSVPGKTNSYVYYPYREGKAVVEEDIRKARQTWEFLEKTRDKLPKNARKCWPYLVRRRSGDLLCPKIISPHLMLMPRFALDMKGKYAISRAPFMIPRKSQSDLELLKFFTAVLNSTVVHWYLGTHAYRYSHGYVKLDPAYLENVPVPDLARTPPSDFQKIVRMVEERIRTGNAGIDKKIDESVLEVYGLSASERSALGIGT